jgi:hypothetical protein
MKQTDEPEKSMSVVGSRFTESHPYRLSTRKQGNIEIYATFGRARVYPNGLRKIWFINHIESPRTLTTPAGPISAQEWPEFRRIVAKIVADVSERLGVQFEVESHYHSCEGTYAVEFHRRILPTPPIVIFRD